MTDRLSQRVYDHVCRQLLSGTLAGGDRLSELTLARETGASRSPVREALVRLRAEGLVEHVPRLGSSVRTPARQDLEALYVTRQWLEAGAAAALADADPAPDLTTLQQLNDQMLQVARDFYRVNAERLDADTARRLALLDSEYHLEMARATGNGLGLEMLARTHMLIQIGRYRLAQHTREQVARIYTDHDLILRAIRRRDAREAAALVVGHVRWGSEAVRAQFVGLDDRKRDGPAADWPEAMRAILEAADGAPAPTRGLAPIADRPAPAPPARLRRGPARG